MSLTFDELRKQNVSRCEESFHPLSAWSPTDWACAMGGECGEALNATKKLKRIETEGIDSPANAGLSRTQLLMSIADEVADMVIYADLLLASIGQDLGAVVVDKFNRTSEKVRSSRRLVIRVGE